MPEYTYIDSNEHRKEVVHRMLYSTGVICEICGEKMWRLPPRRVAVNWGGFSVSEMSPEIQELYTDVDRKRDEFRERHDEHEKRTALPGN